MLLKQVLEKKMEVKRPRGRARIGMINDRKEGSYIKIKRRAEDSVAWRSWMPVTCLRADNGNNNDDDDFDCC